MKREHHRSLKTASAAIAIGMVLTGAAGCTSSSSSNALAGTCLTNGAGPLALAVGVRSDVPQTLFPGAVSALLKTTATDGEQISLIRIDGQPKIFTPPVFSTSDKNSSAISTDVNTYLNTQIQPILQSTIHAKVPQVDILTALGLAAAATAPDGNIVVIDSGLQTVAPLEYQEAGLLMAPATDIVSSLRQKNLIPNLKGRHVLLSGFGYTAAPQPELDQSERDNVISQWEAIVQAGGGCVTADPAPNTAQEISGLPPVATVPLPPPVVIHPCGTTILSDSGSVGFVDGESTFRDPSEADATLRQLAGTLKESSEHITLIGSTSSEGGDAINNPLSQNRAAAVKSVLVSMGIAAGRITAMGEGSHWSGRVPDIGPGGELLPAQAEQDREVIVQLPSCSTTS